MEKVDNMCEQMETFIREVKTIRKSQREIVGINSNPDEEFLWLDHQ